MPITVSSPVSPLFQGKGAARKPQTSKPAKSPQPHTTQSTGDSFQPQFAGRTTLESIQKKIEKATSNRSFTSEDLKTTLINLKFYKKDNHYEYGNGSVKLHLEHHPTSPRAGQSSPKMSQLILSQKAEQVKIPITIAESW